MPTLDVSLGPSLKTEQAEAIFARGQEAVVFALLEMAKLLAESQGLRASVSSPSTPSGRAEKRISPRLFGTRFAPWHLVVY